MSLQTQKALAESLTLFEHAVEEWLLEQGYSEIDATRLIGKFYNRAREMGREKKDGV